MKRRPLAGLLAAALVVLVGAPVMVGSAEAAAATLGCRLYFGDDGEGSSPSVYSDDFTLTLAPAAPAAGDSVAVAVDAAAGPNNGPVQILAGTLSVKVDLALSVGGVVQAIDASYPTVTTPGSSGPTKNKLGPFNATASFSASGSGAQSITVTRVKFDDTSAANADTYCSAEGDRDHRTAPEATTITAGFTVGGVAVPKDDTTTTVTATPPSVLEGGSVSLSATVAGGSTPTGSVTFKDGATILGSGTLNGSGVATFATTSLAPGTRTVTAVYGGDGTHNGSQDTVVVTVTAKTATTTTLTATPASAEEGAALALAATVTGFGGTPTGTVTFRDGATAIGSPVALTAGAANASVTTLAAGARSLTAVYSGNADFATSTSAAVPVTITPKSSSISTKTKTETIEGLFCTVLNTSTKAWTAAGPASGTPAASPKFTFTVTPGAPAPGIQASVGLGYDVGPAPGPLDIPAGATVPKATVQVTGTTKPIVLVGPAFGAVPGYIANPASRLPAATMTGTFTVPASGTVDLVTQSVAFDYKDPADPSSGFTWPDANPVETFDTVCNKSTTNTQTAAVPIGFAISVPVGTEKPLPDTKPPANGPLTVTGTPVAGGQVTISGSGFKPSSPVTVGIYSAPTFVGQFQTSAAGELNQAITLPGSLSGTHTIVAIGSNPAGAQFVLEAPVTIAAASGGTTGAPDTGTSAGTLPETGPGDSIPALIIGLIALQIGLVVAVRSHRALAPAMRGGGRHRLGV